MFTNTYFSKQYFPESYYPPITVDVIIPPPSGGGGTSGSAPGTKFNQAPDTRENKPLLLAQALQEDEDMILLIKAFAEVIRWH